IWPNFRAQGWKAYYSCYSTDDATSTFAAKPFAIGRAIESEASVKGRGKRRYWRTENFPEGIICSASVANTQTKQMETIDAGLLLLSQPELVQSRERTYSVG